MNQIRINLHFRIILEHITDIDVTDVRGLTPLHVAVKASIEPNVTLLLEYGANPNAAGQKGETPLHKAKSSKMAQILLTFGADMYISKSGKDEVRRNALDVFLSKNSSVAEMLMSECISCNDQDLTSSNLLVVYDLEPFQGFTKAKHSFKQRFNTCVKMLSMK
jgi:hypothetical protein